MKEFFYTITESMLDLGLRGTELNLFAVIFGYSQKGDGCCYCDKEELARRCGVSSTRTIDAALSSLQEKGLIVKVSVERNGRKRTAFSYSNSANSAPQGVQILRGKDANSAPLNIIENKERNINTPPTPQEVAKYASERGFRDPAGFAATFVAYYEAAHWCKKDGSKIRNWRQAVITWEANNKNRVFPKDSNSENKQIGWEQYEKIMQN